MAGQKSRYWIAGVYLLLLLAAIPWYWPRDNILYLLGLPLWVIISVAVALLASMFTAWVFLTPAASGSSDHCD
ncbi:MAG: hypothetical protein ACE5GZ_02640 [Gammaproteobacteria bacterium]